MFVQEGNLDYVPYKAGPVTDCPGGISVRMDRMQHLHGKREFIIYHTVVCIVSQLRSNVEQKQGWRPQQ